MKKNLNINAIRNGKKVSKSLGFVNPDVANSLVGGFAQMVNALTNDTFVNSEVVKVMDTSEEESSSTPTPAPAGKTEGVITCDNNFVTVDGTNATVNVSYNGDGTLTGFTAPWTLDEAGSYYAPITIDGGVATLNYQTSGDGDDFFVGAFYAQATDNYTAAVHVFYARR